MHTETLRFRSILGVRVTLQRNVMLHCLMKDSEVLDTLILLSLLFGTLILIFIRFPLSC